MWYNAATRVVSELDYTRRAGPVGPAAAESRPMAGKRIDEHTLRVLEFEDVKGILASFAASDLGRDAAKSLYPSVDARWVQARIAETT